MLYVINNGDTTHEDRFNGQDFVFEPKKAVELSEDAAAHMFGYGINDKTQTLIRLGWLINSGNKAAGLKKLGVFQFLEREPPPAPTADEFRMVPAAEQEDGQDAMDEEDEPQTEDLSEFVPPLKTKPISAEA